MRRALSIANRSTDTPVMVTGASLTRLAGSVEAHRFRRYQTIHLGHGGDGVWAVWEI